MCVLMGLLLGCQEKLTSIQGVYTMCSEVEGFSEETIELQDGKFRYWFYSDVLVDGEPTYPLEGAYCIFGSTLTLEHPRIHEPVRTIAVVNGVNVLWRKDGLDLWKKEGRIHAYAVLLRVEGITGEPGPDGRPSIAVLKSAKLQERERGEYEGRYNDQPAEVRVLLRARSLRGDSDMVIYKEEIARARAQPDPKLLAQLIGLLGRDSGPAIPAMNILEDLFLETWLLKEPPPFVHLPASKIRAIEDLIGALSSAPDRRALESALMLFLRISGIGKIDLSVPGSGIRIILEVGPNGGGSYGSEGAAANDTDWVKSMSTLIPACQQWMSAQLTK